MDSSAEYNSPFRSNVYESTQVDTVRKVYRQRISDLYHSAFPSLLEKTEDIPSTEEQTEEEEAEQNEDAVNGNDEKKEDVVIEKKENESEKKEVDDGNAKEEANDNENAKEKEKETDDAEKKESAAPSKELISTERQKLDHALKLLDTEYFGREQVLYERVFAKYGNGQPLSEYTMLRYSTPLISEVLQSEQEVIVCSECLQEYGAEEFPEDEFDHGFYLACSRCAPDRNTEIALKWHPQFKSDSVILSENGFVAKLPQFNNHRYATADQRPVSKGIHCWRWCTKHYQSWFLWGISHSKKHTDSSYGNQGVFGIAGSNQSYKNGQCTYNIQTGVFFGGKKQVLVDMLLDLNAGELKFKVPGNETEAKMTGIPKDKAEGWVPHCNMHYANASVQIKKIPGSWYGKHPARVKFK